MNGQACNRRELLLGDFPRGPYGGRAGGVRVLSVVASSLAFHTEQVTTRREASFNGRHSTVEASAISAAQSSRLSIKEKV
jgi:hypothetical protein